MKISFTRKEYRALLDMVFVSHWVISAPTNNDTAPAKYEALREKIYSYAKEFQCDDFIEYDESFEKYFETAQLENEGAMNFLNEYEEYVLHNAELF